MSGSGTAQGKVEIKASGDVKSTFTLGDGRSFSYSGKLSLPDVYAVKDCTCEAVLTYKAPSQGGNYNWTSEKKGDIIQVKVDANGGNTILIDIPATNLVKRSEPHVAFFDAKAVPSGSFSLQPLAA